MTVQIHISGLVQGVGFRPHVYRLAVNMGMKGWVNNGNDGVHIMVTGELPEIRAFYESIIQHPPAHAIISRHQMEEIPPRHFNEFTIQQSETGHSPDMMITPDFAICPQCREEMRDRNNRRYRYPFITCTHCGPRYSIIKGLPYDRHHTSMEPYTMCRHCDREFHEPRDRRHFSQTNSCPDCGINMFLYNPEGECICTDYECILTMVKEELCQGRIIAVKGIGGYLLLTDANNRLSVATLRERKHRPAKPFAVMYPGLEQAAHDLILTEEEMVKLQDTVSPIVLCTLKTGQHLGICHHLVAPGLMRIGAMLPYTPLLELICHAFGKPLIATSANISGSPILYHDEDALEQLTGIADLFLVYDRDIVVPQDDSVMQFTRGFRQPIILRRSRGLAPNYYPHPFSLSGCWLATGAELKSSFAILKGEQCYVSQFLGNQEYFDAQIAYQETLRHLQGMMHMEPDFILADAHPGYQVAAEAETMALKKNIPVYRVQHHQAHFAAVLAENRILDTEDPILGVIWDGTGYGTDGQIWGSEFFSYHRHHMERIAHLAPFPSWLGDRMSREPRISAVAICENAEMHSDKFTTEQWQYYLKLLRNKPELLTTSMGRFLDGIASILGLCNQSSYEGEAAMKLEALATQCGETEINAYPFTLEWEEINWKPMISALLEDLGSGIPHATIALRAHYTLPKMVRAMAERDGFRKIAFSGGVMQNALLNDLMIAELKPDFTLYFHQQLSPNDECISFGQLAYAEIMQRREMDKRNAAKNDRVSIPVKNAPLPSTLNSQPSTPN